MYIETIELGHCQVMIEIRVVDSCVSYIARLTWNRKYDEDNMLVDWMTHVKCFGTYDRAVSWALDEVEFPEFFILKYHG
jgi:hypothetical protein